MNDSHELLDFIKAMADADRLRIIGVLAKRRANKSEIVGRLNLPLRDVVDHLSFLEKVGVIELKDNLYELNTDKVEGLARDHLREEKPVYVPSPDLEWISKFPLKVFIRCFIPTSPSLPSMARLSNLCISWNP